MALGFRTRASALALALFASATAAIEIPFGYNWRYKWVSAWDDAEHGVGGPYGNTPSVDPNTGYWSRIDNYECTGAVQQNPNRFNDTDCATSCAYNPACLLWQHDSSARHCSHGFAGYSCKPSSGKGSYPAGGTRTPQQAQQPLRTDWDWAQPGFDDSSWELVDAPHDALMEVGNFSAGADTHHGFIERNGTIWYRKTFTLPPAVADGRAVFVRFEGVFHFVTVWLDGKPLVQRGNVEGGYSPFVVRLDNATSVPLSAATEHVLVLRVDATYGSGHWYEGGGLYRPVQLLVQDAVHVVEDGLYVSPELDVASGKAVSIPVSLELENLAVSAAASGTSVAADAQATVTVELRYAGAHPLSPPIATATATAAVPQSTGSPASSTVTATAVLKPAAGVIRPWSVRYAPALYNLSATVSVGGTDVDAVYAVTGFRSTNATVTNKYQLNGESFEWRGFSHHNSFVGVGVAMGPRLEFFRVQQSRALGANFWRNSHNPYRRTTYQLLDRLGVVNWDEHRDMGELYLPGVQIMAKRTRTSPAKIVNSDCNEYECGCGADNTGPLFTQVFKAIDPDRPVTANGEPNGNGVDIQGFSHQHNSTFQSYHNQNPNVPLVLSECCSCTSQRLPPSDRELPSCISQQNSPGHLPFVLGSSGVWTLMDYAGESHSWPQVWSSFGQFSFAGYPKPHAWWYRANWLAKRPQSDPGRPAQPQLHVSRVLELPDQLQPGSSPGTALVRAVTDSPAAELFVDGVSQGVLATAADMPDQVQQVEWQAKMSGGNESCVFPTNATVQCHGLTKVDAAHSRSECVTACCASQGCSVWQYNNEQGCWIGDVPESECYPGEKPVPWAGGRRASILNAANITVVGRSSMSGGAVQSSHTLLPPGPPTRLQLYVDAPSPLTGTGSALSLDGTDMALVRAAVEDSQGRLVSLADTNVTFSIVSGPGRVRGVGSGDPACHCPPSGDTCATYAGLVRAVVQVTADCVSLHRDVVPEMDRDAGKRTVVAGLPGKPCPVDPIVVAASAVINGTTVRNTISITTSDDPADTPLETARTVGAAGAAIDAGAWLEQSFQG